jgi:hypothetical protein
MALVHVVCFGYAHDGDHSLESMLFAVSVLSGNGVWWRTI